MKTREGTRHYEECGFALLAAVAGLVLASAVVLGMTTLARVEVLSSFNYKRLVQADTLAEAGLHSSIEWLSYTYPTLTGTNDVSNFEIDCYPVVTAGATCADTPVSLAGVAGSTGNFPLSPVQTAFQTALSGISLPVGSQTGEFAVDAEMLAVRQVTTGMFPPFQTETAEKWQVTAEGAIGGATSRQWMVIERVFNSFFSHALYGICSVTRVAGDSVTDSYDSRLGPYGGANSFDVGAGIGSNGSVTTEGTNLEIGGDVTYGPGTGGCPGGDPTTVNPSVVNGGINERPPRDFPPLPAFPAPSAVDVSVNSGVNPLAPGNYGDILVQGNGTIALQGGTEASPTVYYFESLAQMGNNATISILPTGGFVEIHVRGEPVSGATLPPGCASAGLYLGGTGILSGIPVPPPRTVRVNYYGSNCLVIQGAATASATIYAPLADARLGGNGSFYGSVVALRTELYGSRSLHYDTNLDNLFGSLGPARVLAYSRQKY